MTEILLAAILVSLSWRDVSLFIGGRLRAKRAKLRGKRKGNSAKTNRKNRT